MKEESLLLLSDLQKLINQVVLIDYTIIILGVWSVSYTHLDVYKRQSGHYTIALEEIEGCIADQKTVEDEIEARELALSLIHI